MLIQQLMKAARALAVAGIALATIAATPAPARAHCDTMDGPVVTAAKRALESGQINGVLIWVGPREEAQVRSAFAHALAVRKLGPQAMQLADHHFFETVVRLHRQGEGEPYTGLKPAGTDAGPAITAADGAVASGSAAELERVLVHAVRDGIRERLERVNAAKGFATDDVAAGRAWVAAYVALLHYAETVHGAAAGAAHGQEPAAKPHDHER